MAKNVIKEVVAMVSDAWKFHQYQMEEWRSEDPENYYEYTFNQMEV